MLVAIAFLCAVSAADCEREAVVRAVVGQGATPVGCLIDGMAGVAANQAFALDEKFRVEVACRRKEQPD